ncbi:MAG: hypothetical protein E6Q76_14715 [Rhizobium sp.]|nr:MAG: hypothetical protein E6Q76_14715 [Rhizobium sp.]
MTTFYFTTQDSECVLDEGEECDLPDLLSAIEQAKEILAEMAFDGIPRKNGEQLIVEIARSDKRPVARLSLKMEISYLVVPDGVGEGHVP